MKPIGKGARGSSVVDIQRRLILLGFDLGKGGADGSFGPKTEKAVKEFQKQSNLNVTGVVDSLTWHELVEATYKLGDRVLYLRSPLFKGADVTQLQLWLNKLGFNTGHIDGIFGEATERAVREFQRNVGLVTDGIVGASTVAALHNLRNILEKETSRVFPDPERSKYSTITIFKGLLVILLAPLEEKTKEAYSLCDEVSKRLGNLLQLLGANIVFSEPQNPKPVRVNRYKEVVCIGLEADLEEKKAFTSCCVLYSDDKRRISDSKQLANFVNDEIVNFLALQSSGVQPIKISALYPQIPLIIVRLKLGLGELLNQDLPGEVARQRLAVSVFDGIKNFIQAKLEKHN
jgi:peptidoglycan hydrolase-like protein with peptidoglycan-binding domain